MTVLTTYLGVLRDQWTAVVDVAGLLQTDDLFQLSDLGQPMPVPDLEHLWTLCCDHPCGTADAKLRGADGSWPLAFPAAKPAAPQLRLEIRSTPDIVLPPLSLETAEPSSNSGPGALPNSIDGTLTLPQLRPR